MGSLLGWLGWFVACLVGYVLSWLAAHWVPAVLDLVKGLFACFLHAGTRPDVGMLRWLVGWLLGCMCAHFVVWPCVCLWHVCLIMHRCSCMACLLALLCFICTTLLLCDGLHWKGLLALSYCLVGGVVGCFMQLVGFLVDGFLC